MPARRRRRVGAVRGARGRLRALSQEFHAIDATLTNPKPRRCVSQARARTTLLKNEQRAQCPAIKISARPPIIQLIRHCESLIFAVQSYNHWQDRKKFDGIGMVWYMYGGHIIKQLLNRRHHTSQKYPAPTRSCPTASPAARCPSGPGRPAPSSSTRAGVKCAASRAATRQQKRPRPG